jgi:UDP-2-acetamido-3-amino-2,3-dideoxy-glucuronate N-acetyltransferase
MSKIGVIGAGYWGKNLLRNFEQLGSLYAICDQDCANPNFAAYKDQERFTSYSDLLRDENIDGVAVSTPAESHYEIVREALMAGKHVYVEKPLCLSEKEGTELNSLSKKNGLVLMVGHLLQYHPAFLKLKDLVERGELGKIQYIYSNRLNLGKIRREENILWSFAPHDISMILSLAGEMPESVCTNGGNYLSARIADVTLSSLTFANGINAHVFVSWLHPYKEQKLIVVGDKGMAVFDDMARREDKLLVFHHKINWKNGNIPVPVKENAVAIQFEDKEPLNEECRHFIECVQTGATPRTDGEEGLRVLKVLNALQSSLENNTMPVRIGKAGNGPSANAPQNSFENSRMPVKNRQNVNGYFAHESSCIDENVEIGKGSKVWHFSHIMNGSKIGEDCIIGQNVVIGPDATVGSRCKIQNNVSIYKGVTLEDEVFCGPSCVFTNVYTPRAFIERKSEFRPTIVRKGASIGANATIVCGVTVGQYGFIGAGAVVKSDVMDHAIVAGVPARQIGWACKCGTPLKFNSNSAHCDYCSNEYGLKEGHLDPIKEEN